MGEQRPAREGQPGRGVLLGGGEEVGRSAERVTPPHRGLVEDVLDAEGSEGLVGVGRWWEVIQGAPPPFFPRGGLGFFFGSHGGAGPLGAAFPTLDGDALLRGKAPGGTAE